MPIGGGPDGDGGGDSADRQVSGHANGELGTLDRIALWISGRIASLRRLPRRLRRSARRLTGRIENVPPSGRAHDRAYRRYRRVVARYDRLRGVTAEEILDQLRARPSISVVAGDPRAAGIDDQIYPNVEAVRETSEAGGEWTLRLRPGDRLSADALVWIAHAVEMFPDAQVIYFDEDRLDASGRHRDPWFKPAFNPELLLGENALGRGFAIRSGLLAEVPADLSDHAYSLAATAGIAPGQIVHIPRILLHRCDGAPRQAADLGAVQAHLAKHWPGAQAAPHPDLAGHVQPIPPVPTPAPLVSILIPTRNNAHLLQRCLDTLYSRTAYGNFEVIIADNGSDDPETIAILNGAPATFENLRVLDCPYAFNFARLSNDLVEAAAGVFIVLMNDDIEVEAPDWVELMLGWANAPGCGPIGAGLWYPQRTLQHGGVVLGTAGGPKHLHLHLPDGHPGGYARAAQIQRVSAVTAAVLMINKDLYLRLGGMDAENLAIAFNDVDLCLRSAEQGHAAIWTPFARFLHRESATRGSDRAPEKIKRFHAEKDVMAKRWDWDSGCDPYYNPNLSKRASDFSLADVPGDLSPRIAALPARL